MIRIHKPNTPPAKLTGAGKNKRRSHSLAYTRDPKAYRTGKEFGFDARIYAHPSVKQELITAQHGKCCFCERLIGSDGDVEHFRPKRAYKQAPGDPLERPGYYWLAYEWDNLYLACPGCNQRHKQNLFPLQHPSDRAIDHKGDIQREQPLFIDPGKENPEDFISFRSEFPFAIHGNPKGEATIAALKLDQRSLPEARLQRLQILRSLHLVVQKAAEHPENRELQEMAMQAQEELEKGFQDQAEFAAAARAARQSNFRYVMV